MISGGKRVSVAGMMGDARRKATESFVPYHVPYKNWARDGG